MEILSLVIHRQKQNDLIKAISDIQDFSYLKLLTTHNRMIIESKIKFAFDKYNENSLIDKLEFDVEFDLENGRTHMNINQVPLISNLHPYFKLG